MAIPTFKGVGAKATFLGTGSVTVPYPTGSAAPVKDDVCLLFVETNNDDVQINTDNGGNWTEIGPPTDAATTRLTAYWSRFQANNTAPVLGTSGNIDHALAAIAVFSGVITTGNPTAAVSGDYVQPWNVTNAGVDNTSDTSFTGTGNTTRFADCLVVVMATLSRDSNLDTQWSSFANANLSNFTEIVDYGTNVGVGGSIGAGAGGKAVAGTYGDTTATRAAASVSAYRTIALLPDTPRSDDFTWPMPEWDPAGEFVVATPSTSRIVSLVY